MKKGINKKLNKLVEKVFFQRHTNKSNGETRQMSEKASQIKEIEALKDQIDILRGSLNNLKLEIEEKEVKVAKLAREKEKLSMSLYKVRRSNLNLAQQLEDERNFYFKEKEEYCREMNEYKKLKKVLSNTNIGSQIDKGEEIEKLKKTLEQTLQTNYNLSIKFLRMKETKNYLGNCLNKAEEEHRHVVNNLKCKIESLTTELKDILQEKFETPLSPSNKKYLQLINQNGSLVYENLCLQMQVDQLHLKLKQKKIQRTKSEASNRNKKKHKSKYGNFQKSLTTITDENQTKIIKIFEREKKPGIPTVTILNEHEIAATRFHHSAGKLQLPNMNESKLEIFQISELQSRATPTNSMLIIQRSKSAPNITQSVAFKRISNL